MPEYTGHEASHWGGGLGGISHLIMQRPQMAAMARQRAMQMQMNQQLNQQRGAMYDSQSAEHQQKAQVLAEQLRSLKLTNDQREKLIPLSQAAAAAVQAGDMKNPAIAQWRGTLADIVSNNKSNPAVNALAAIGQTSPDAELKAGTSLEVADKRLEGSKYATDSRAKTAADKLASVGSSPKSGAAAQLDYSIKLKKLAEAAPDPDEKADLLRKADIAEQAANKMTQFAPKSPAKPLRGQTITESSAPDKDANGNIRLDADGNPIMKATSRTNSIQYLSPQNMQPLNQTGPQPNMGLLAPVMLPRNDTPSAWSNTNNLPAPAAPVSTGINVGSQPSQDAPGTGQNSGVGTQMMRESNEQPAATPSAPIMVRHKQTGQTYTYKGNAADIPADQFDIVQP